MAQHENDDDDVCPNSLVDSSDDEEDYDNGDSNVKSQSQHSSAYTTATKFSKRKGDRKPLQSIDPKKFWSIARWLFLSILPSSPL